MLMETTRATIDDLREARPDLVGPFVAALPGARSAVLGQVWGAFSREPLPGIAGRRHEGDTLVVDLERGGSLTGSAGGAQPFAHVPDGFEVAGPDGPISGAVALLGALGLETPAARRLAAELDNSVTNLALARAASAGGPAPVRDAVDAEQAVVDGHPLHPCCRTRTGMSVADVLAYAPEHHPIVRLSLVAVPAERWLAAGDWPEELRDGDTVLMPVHPWQRDHVLVHHPDLAVAGRTIEARPLMSLRTLAPLGELPGYHVKTALDVQMTSMWRTISGAEVADGPPLSELVCAVLDKAGYGDRLHVLRELGGGSVRIGGTASASLAAMIRESGERYAGPGEIAVPLSALQAVGAFAAAGDPLRWFADLTDLVLPPALTLLASGIALEAHGQNTLVVLRDGWPVRALYRDLDGVRIHPDRLAAHGFTLPGLSGTRAGLDTWALRTKLFGNLLSVAFGELVEGLARQGGADPQELWAVAGDIGRRVYADLPDAGDDRAVFFGDTLSLPARTAMRLAEDSVTVQWIPVPNPLARHR
jgi:siderophore synthetase component